MNLAIANPPFSSLFLENIPKANDKTILMTCPFARLDYWMAAGHMAMHGWGYARPKDVGASGW